VHQQQGGEKKIRGKMTKKNEVPARVIAAIHALCTSSREGGKKIRGKMTKKNEVHARVIAAIHALCTSSREGGKNSGKK
jgi:hypothetical protein